MITYRRSIADRPTNNGEQHDVVDYREYLLDANLTYQQAVDECQMRSLAQDFGGLLDRYQNKVESGFRTNTFLGTGN